MPAAESSSHQQAGLPPAKEGKEKKEKPKSKTAQQVRRRPVPARCAVLGLAVALRSAPSGFLFPFFNLIC